MGYRTRLDCAIAYTPVQKIEGRERERVKNNFYFCLASYTICLSRSLYTQPDKTLLYTESRCIYTQKCALYSFPSVSRARSRSPSYVFVLIAFFYLIPSERIHYRTQTDARGHFYISLTTWACIRSCTSSGTPNLNFFSLAFSLYTYVVHTV